MRRLPTLLTLCLISGASHAADNGFYLGAGMGISNFDSGAMVDDSDTGFKLIAGFRFFPSYFRIGGLREDLARGFHDAVNAFLDRFIKGFSSRSPMKSAPVENRLKPQGTATSRSVRCRATFCFACCAIIRSSWIRPTPRARSCGIPLRARGLPSCSSCSASTQPSFPRP